MTEPTALEKLLFSGPPVPPIRPDTPHYEAVGRFVTWFANAESTVHVLARKLSGMPEAKARIVFGGMRLTDLTEIVRQMARIDAIPDVDYAEIDACLTQLNFIGSKRHALVHRSSNFFDNKIVVSNIQNAKSISAFEIEAFEIGQLADMQIDLSRILLRLRYVANPADFNGRAMLDVVLSMRGQPWLYKHMPSRAPHPKSRDKSSRQQHQPGVSRASRRRAAMERATKKEAEIRFGNLAILLVGQKIQAWPHLSFVGCAHLYGGDLAALRQLDRVYRWRVAAAAAFQRGSQFQ